MKTMMKTMMSVALPLVQPLLRRWVSRLTSDELADMRAAASALTEALTSWAETGACPGGEAAARQVTSPYGAGVATAATTHSLSVPAPMMPAFSAVSSTATACAPSEPPATPKAVPPKPTPAAPADGQAEEVNLPLRIRRSLRRHWDLRYNALTSQVEWREAGCPEAPFEPLTERKHNTMVLRVQEEIPLCYKSWIDSSMFSDHVPLYHPLRGYLEALPAWDGVDRVGELARRVSTEALWEKVFRRWMRGMVKGWTMEGRDSCEYANQMAPLLISERQGLGKSTFCRLLLPPALRGYYVDKFDLVSDARSEQRLCDAALINMDEFDRYSERQAGTLKNLMQLTELHVRRPYRRGLVHRSRVASFIGTSNYTELLRDPTGSRRFYCQAVTRPIERSAIDYEQVYAQLLSELASGEPTYFSKTEETEIEQHNRSFYATSPLMDAFLQHYEVVDASRMCEARWLSPSRIYEELKSHYAHALRDASLVKLGKSLRALGVPRRRTALSTTYAVVRRRS